MSKTSIIGTSALKDKLQEYATKVGRISAVHSCCSISSWSAKTLQKVISW